MRSTWIEALAMVDMVTGKFGVASTRLPPMSRPSDRTAISEPDQQTLEGAIKAAEEYLAQIVGRFSPGQAKPKEINGEDTWLELQEGHPREVCHRRPRERQLQTI
jgi:hypothetical protein